MNTLCQAPGCLVGGYCTRHRVEKSLREVQLCRGENCQAKTTAKYWEAWEQGKMPGQLGAVSEPKSFREGLILPEPRTGGLVQRHGFVTTVGRGGVGTEMKAILSWFGQRPTGGCKCEYYAFEMDRRGVDWCQENIDEIFNWISKEAKKRHIPWIGTPLDQVPGFEWTARQLIQKAIDNAKAKGQSITDKVLRSQEARQKLNPFYWDGSDPRWISSSQLMKDALTLSSKLPSNISCIIGIARSGLCVATMIAMLRHLPLQVFRQSSYDLVDGGNGWRLQGNISGDGPPVVIDDTCMTGNSFKYVMPVVKRTYPNALSAAVYVNPAARVKPNIWAVDLPWPHILEWNVFNSILSPNLSTEIDGVLLERTSPKYLSKKTTVPLIVTSRSEAVREETNQCLSQNGLHVKEMVMAPWDPSYTPSTIDIVDYKKPAVDAFVNRSRMLRPALYFEPVADAAKELARQTGGVIICPTSGECFNGDPECSHYSDNKPTPSSGFTFEGNFLNHIQAVGFICDLDGVFRMDWDGRNEDRYEEDYMRWLETAPPTDLVPTRKVRAIVSGSLGKFRDITESWLKKHGVDYEELILPFSTKWDRENVNVGQVKARYYLRMPEATLFVESCPHQSSTIASITRRPVYCTSTRRLFN